MRRVALTGTMIAVMLSAAGRGFARNGRVDVSAEVPVAVTTSGDATAPEPSTLEIALAGVIVLCWRTAAGRSGRVRRG